MPYLMKVNEVAQAVRLSPATVRRMCAAGQISGAVRIGATWRIPRDSVCKMLDPGYEHSRKDVSNE